IIFFFFSSRRRHTRWPRDWSSDVCSSDLGAADDRDRAVAQGVHLGQPARLVARRDEEQIAAGDHEMRERGVVADEQSDPAGMREIGRASCRERGEIVVGGGSLRKKRKKRV